jgi:hypothetical protein
MEPVSDEMAPTLMVVDAVVLVAAALGPETPTRRTAPVSNAVTVPANRLLVLR